MAKDPAFLFYPGDWTLGTMHMTLVEKGAYIELLMLQFARGRFTIAHAKHMLNGSFDVVWATVIEKFKTDGEYYWNERLESEKTKRAHFTDSRRVNALKNTKKEENNTKDMQQHMLQHMENENENENKDNNKGVKSKNFIPPTITDVVEYFNQNGYSEEAARKAFQYYNVAGWKSSDGKQVRNWKQKMIAVWFKPEYRVNGSKPIATQRISRNPVAV